MGNPRPVRVKDASAEYLLLLLFQKQADILCKQAVGVRLCTQLQKLAVYIGMLVYNYFGPVILKRWSLSLPAFF